jgi:hypothetical protein
VTSRGNRSCATEAAEIQRHRTIVNVVFRVIDASFFQKCKMSNGP